MRGADGTGANTMGVRTTIERYNGVAMALHWAIAAAVMGLAASGLWMVTAIKEPATQAQAFAVYQWHKSLGLTVLVLMVARLIWRLAKPPPALPASLPAHEKAMAHAAHWSLYVLLIAVPILGWAMVSASVYGLPTIRFGLFEWPHLPVLPGLADKKPVEDALRWLHGTAAYAVIAIVGVHILAVLKHEVMDADGGVVTRMLPGGDSKKGEKA
ncbi:MAG: cytochrome b [Hyphomicrobiaceae bacterium]|nr:cytochrome b [Hyphomicrobiaceae bacterium]